LKNLIKLSFVKEIADCYVVHTNRCFISNQKV